MNLKSWSWDLNFWTLLVLQGSGSHRWFPSPKKISGFHNQNLCENLNRASFARTSWFLVKVHIKANNCRIILFEQFRIPEWRNRPQNWNLREKLGKTGTSWKFWLFGQDLCKSQFFRNWTVCTISKLQMKKQISKSECTRKTEWNRPFLKILTFWSKSKFYLFKVFFFFYLIFFAGVSDRVRFPGRSGSNLVGYDIIRDVIALGVCVSAWRVACRSTWYDEGGERGAYECVKWRWWSPYLLVARGSAWWCF